MKKLRYVVAGALPVCVLLMAPSAHAQDRVSDAHALTVVKAPIGKVVGGEYMVRVKEGVSALDVSHGLGISTKHTFTKTINGFSAKLTPKQLADLRVNPDVVRISENKKFKAAGQQVGASWGLDRIDQTSMPLNMKYNYTTDGNAVRAYVIDTGIKANHPYFENRAMNVYDASGGSGTDCNGHGTGVAGVIGSSKYGVAKQIKLRGVKVTTDCGAEPDVDDLIAGIDWVASNAVLPAVANISIGGGYDQDVNDAAAGLVNNGIFTAAAAGNEGEDACLTSPASAPGVMTVAASDKSDGHASGDFGASNSGWCVELYAPGKNITTTSQSGGITSRSGTSFATPFVVGVAALVLQKNGLGQSPLSVYNWIDSNASVGKLYNVPDDGTPNRLLQSRNILNGTYL